MSPASPLLQDECKKLSSWLSTRLGDYRYLKETMQYPANMTASDITEFEAEMESIYQNEKESFIESLETQYSAKLADEGFQFEDVPF